MLFLAMKITEKRALVEILSMHMDEEWHIQ